jgi:peptidoglycan/xylan/chitin deacetylase (PgdA/CDA1 family)
MSLRLRPGLRRAFARLPSLMAAPREGLRILTYHRVNGSHPHDRLSVHPDAFALQMELLARCERPVLPLALGVAGLRGEAPLPHGALALTFDDGFADNFTVAAPILARFGFPATFFVVSGNVGSGESLDRYRACCADDRMLNWDQVRSLRERGHDVGGHGRSHRELGGLPAVEAREEIVGCALDLERATGVRPRAFCYPRGSVSAVARQLVGEAGFEAGCTVRPGPNCVGDDPLMLARTEVSGDDDIEDFRVKLAGGFDAWHRLVQVARGLTA